MGYAEENLLNGEQIAARARLHWIGLVGYPFAAVVMLVHLTLTVTRAGSDPILLISYLVLFVVVVIAGAAAFMTYRTSEFAVTNKRVLLKVGWIRRNSLEVLLTKVEGIQVRQGILGRVLGYGSIVVTGTGGSKDPFHHIAAPLAFRKRIQEQIEVNQQREHPGT